MLDRAGASPAGQKQPCEKVNWTIFVVIPPRASVPLLALALIDCTNISHGPGVV